VVLARKVAKIVQWGEKLFFHTIEKEGHLEGWP